MMTMMSRGESVLLEVSATEGFDVEAFELVEAGFGSVFESSGLVYWARISATASSE